jgi:hypothetical protein
MKNKALHIFIIICVIFVASTIYISYIKKESFIPSINMIYRPHVRTIRKYYDNNIQNIFNKVNNVLKRYNLINIYK